MTFTESGLIFRFHPSWRVVKYDGHRYYQALAGQGLKGVDFVALTEQEGVVLIEVKNFDVRWRRRDFRWDQPALEALAVVLAEKVEDTYKGIDAIWQAYQRRWWFRLLLPMLRQLSPFRSEYAFWIRVHEALQDPQRVSLLIWLAGRAPRGQAAAQLVDMLRADLRSITAKVELGSSTQQPYPDHLGVTASLAG